MAIVSTELREKIIAKTINRGPKSLREIADENNIGLSTLNNWLHRWRASGKSCESQGLHAKIAGDLSMEEKFNHLLASNNLEAIELGKYCRKHGLYTHQLLEWRKLFIMTKNNNALNAANHLI
jgi:transposase-like protein